ncbi:NAD(P)H-binding protein [Jiangella endophytica]|uniref:NAD(P)H-binding protein n=1 Tax=Jiangella endophytica TaxID=1623398 RepID=UPI000E352F72|nr:NAD(P)H-binding protein [Jiangella endophytica]
MTILVTGATGSVGRLVVDQLLALGATDVRALVRNPAKATLPDGVEVVTGYVAEPDSLDGVFDGVERMYLTSYSDTAAEVLARAEKAGVHHVVSLSGERESWWGSIVDDVEASGVPWTHLWPGEFMENSTIWADQIRTTGQVRDGYARSANAAIAMDDVAAVAAVALVQAGHVGRAYTLTGPETLTRAEKVALIGRALGRDVPYVELNRDDAIAELSASMGEYAEWYVDGEGEQVDNPQQSTTTVADVLGRPATTFSDWAVRNATLFR